MSVTEKVTTRVKRMQKGVPFPINGFYSLGSSASVQKALSRLAQQGEIVRVSNGYYVRPKPLAGIPSLQTKTSAVKVAQRWARENGYTLVPQGQEAAYRLGLQTQAPVKTIYWTNGPSRRFAIGNEVVEVRHVGKQKLRWAGQPAGTVLRSLTAIPPESTELADLAHAFQRLSLSEEESRAVVRKLNAIPLPQAWQVKLKQLEQSLAS